MRAELLALFTLEFCTENSEDVFFAAWNELHLSAMGARAMLSGAMESLVLSSGFCIGNNQAFMFALNGLVDRMSVEIVSKMAEMCLRPFELACIHGIILLNPGKRIMCKIFWTAFKASPFLR